MGKLLNILLFLAGIILFAFALEYYSPIKPSQLLGSPGVVEQGTCSRLININNDSLEPVLANGSTVVFNRCLSQVQKESLDKGSVVLIENFFGRRTLSIVRSKFRHAGDIYYMVSTEKDSKNQEQILAKDITAVYEP